MTANLNIFTSHEVIKELRNRKGKGRRDDSRKHRHKCRGGTSRKWRDEEGRTHIHRKKKMSTEERKAKWRQTEGLVQGYTVRNNLKVLMMWFTLKRIERETINNRGPCNVCRTSCARRQRSVFTARVSLSSLQPHSQVATTRRNKREHSTRGALFVLSLISTRSPLGVERTTEGYAISKCTPSSLLL